MEDVKVVQYRPDGSDAETLYAASGKYYDGRWWLFDLAIQAHDHYNNPAGPVKHHQHRQMAEWLETPEDFVQDSKDPSFMSARDLYLFLRQRALLSEKTQARYAVDLHGRLAMPWACLVVMLFGIPCGVHTARQGALAGALTALLIFFGFYLLMTYGQWLGKEQYLSPLLSAWLPNLVFACAGLIMTARMR